MHKKLFVSALVFIALAALVAAPNVGVKRVIVQSTNAGDYQVLLDSGCSVWRTLKTVTALNCPAVVTEAKGLQEDVRVFAQDLNADKQIGADLVWGIGYTGAGRVVAVLDTGLDKSHPEFRACTNSTCVSDVAAEYDFVNNDSDASDDNGHGTHVAGIITANGVVPGAKGVAPDAKLAVAKVLDASGGGYFTDVIAAIYWAADNPAVDAISMSLGTQAPTVWSKKNCDSYYPELTNAIKYAVSKGKTVVVAAGNSGAAGVALPGCISSTIVVGAVDSANKWASFSGVGYSMKDHGIVAPGVSIYSTLIGGYGIASGTSMATPHVSAVVALMKQKNPYLTPAQVKTKLFATAKDFGRKKADPNYGYGLVQALAAVQAS